MTGVSEAILYVYLCQLKVTVSPDLAHSSIYIYTNAAFLSYDIFYHYTCPLLHNNLVLIYNK